MLSEISLAFISFINYFFIPVVSLRIYCKRHSINWKCSFELFYHYVIMCVLNLPIGRICASMVERILSTSVLAESAKYTLLALAVAIVIPYVLEVLEKLIKVDVEITKEKRRDKRENEN